jgi:hypothetical protein
MKNQTTEFPTLRSKDGTMVVSFYPVKLPYGDVSNAFVFKVLEWKGVETISKKFIKKVEQKVQLKEYESLGYVVVKDNSNLPQLGNPMAGAC